MKKNTLIVFGLFLVFIFSYKYFINQKQKITTIGNINTETSSKTSSKSLKDNLNEEDLIKLNTQSLDLDLIIKNIQKSVQNVNTLKDLKVTFFDNEYFLTHGYHPTDNGRELKAFYHNQDLVKLEESVGMSYGRLIYRYYFADDKLVFIYKTEEDFLYDENLEALDYSKLEVGFEKKYYFYNDRLIKIVTGEKGMYSQSHNETIYDILSSLKVLEDLLIQK
jgi:hypothetical protein